MDYTDEIVDHLKLHRHMMVPLIRKLYLCGFQGFLIKGEEVVDLEPYVEREDFASFYAVLADHAGAGAGADADAGAFQIRLRGRSVTNTIYNQNGDSWIELVFLKGPARQFLKQMPDLLVQLRAALFDNFDIRTICDIIDFGADFLVQTENNFSYSISAFGSPIFTGRMDGEVLRVGILDPPTYMRIAFFLLKGADAMALSLRNPFDILALLDTAQAALRHLAFAYEERGLRIEVTGLGQKLFSCGEGVKSNLITNRFGPTALHLDALFKIISSAFAANKGTENAS